MKIKAAYIIILLLPLIIYIKLPFEKPEEKSQQPNATNLASNNEYLSAQWLIRPQAYSIINDQSILSLINLSKSSNLYIIVDKYPSGSIAKLDYDNQKLQFYPKYYALPQYPNILSQTTLIPNTSQIQKLLAPPSVPISDLTIVQNRPISNTFIQANTSLTQLWNLDQEIRIESEVSLKQTINSSLNDESNFISVDSQSLVLTTAIAPLSIVKELIDNSVIATFIHKKAQSKLTFSISKNKKRTLLFKSDALILKELKKLLNETQTKISIEKINDIEIYILHQTTSSIAVTQINNHILCSEDSEHFSEVLSRLQTHKLASESLFKQISPLKNTRMLLYATEPSETVNSFLSSIAPSGVHLPNHPHTIIAQVITSSNSSFIRLSIKD